MEEIFDIIDTQGNPTGETVTREKAHAEGIPHRTAHIWIIREKYGTDKGKNQASDSQQKQGTHAAETHSKNHKKDQN